MRVNDEKTRDYLQELEADNDNLRFEGHAKDEVIKAQDLEIRLLGAYIRDLLNDRTFDIAL